MRLPRRHPWRAIPEFDADSDEQCRACCRLGMHRGLPALLRRVLMIGVWIAVLIGVAWAHALLTVVLQSAGVPLDELDDLASGNVFLLWLLPPTMFLTVFLVLGTRNAVIWCRLRALLRRARCPACRDLLLGLSPTNFGRGPAVKCPECGVKITLHEHNIRRADLEVSEES